MKAIFCQIHEFAAVAPRRAQLRCVGGCTHVIKSVRMLQDASELSPRRVSHASSLPFLLSVIMAARAFTKFARPFQSRGYASQPSSSGGSSILPIAAGVGALGVGAYFFFGGSEQPVNLQKAEKAVAEATGTKKTPTEGGATAFDPKNFQNYKVKEVLPYNHDTSRFVFELPEGLDSGLTVASAVLTRSADPQACQDNEKPVIRPYTPVTSPDTENIMELMIKKYDGGKMSQHIHSLKQGDELAIKGPIKKFDYKPNTWEKTAFIVGGSGFTPAWQVLQAIEANPGASLLYCSSLDSVLIRRLPITQRTRPSLSSFSATRLVYST